jgi:SPP1 gp7 family putative phage head morphogenesis protein
MRKRFRRLRGVIREAVVAQDCFALEEGIMTQQQMTGPGRQAFDFPRSSKKVSAFMDWLQRQQTNGILEVTNADQVGNSVDSMWSNTYINDSYKRGVQRARGQMIEAGMHVPSMEETGGIEATMQAPIHADRVGLLYTRVYNELKGITDAMDQQISRVLSQGLADGDHPRLIARKLNSVISGMSQADLGITDSLGRRIPPERRAAMLARTEVIRAHAEGQLNEFQNWGVEQVNVRAEWVTAGDQRVCPRCASREGETYTIEQAKGLIPLHPQCRCIWLPYRQEN